LSGFSTAIWFELRELFLLSVPQQVRIKKLGFTSQAFNRMTIKAHCEHLAMDSSDFLITSSILLYYLSFELD